MASSSKLGVAQRRDTWGLRHKDGSGGDGLCGPDEATHPRGGTDREEHGSGEAGKPGKLGKLDVDATYAEVYIIDRSIWAFNRFKFDSTRFKNLHDDTLP